MLVALIALGGCASGFGLNDPLPGKVDQLSKKVDHLSTVAKNQNRVALGQQVDQLAEQVRELRGQVQSLSHSVDQANKRQRDLYQDLNRRMNALEQGDGAAGQADSEPPPSDSEAYHQAFDLLQQARYQRAEKALMAFLAHYPDSQFADNAQYWLGETRYVQQDFSGAVDAFNAVVTNYPDSPKIPGALLKGGYSYIALSDWDAAKKMLNKVIKQYPDGTEARLAKKRLQRLAQQGH